MKLRALLTLAMLGCAPPASQADAKREQSPTGEKSAKQAPAVVLMPAGQDTVSVRTEVVYKDEDRQRGLMFRERMDADAGMLFLFEAPTQLKFWMKNTLIPLDMIFIQSDMRVLGVVENATPQTLNTRSVPGHSQYVLEVNAGFARKHGISAGTLTRFEGVPELAQLKR